VRTAEHTDTLPNIIKVFSLYLTGNTLLLGYKHSCMELLIGTVLMCIAAEYRPLSLGYWEIKYTVSKKISAGS
jgi:hypothetical protein